MPNTVWADICSTLRPNWDGGPVSAWSELLHLAQTPIVIALLITTLLVLRFRSQWGGLAVVVGWSFVTYLSLSSNIQQTAASEGCVGNPALFIAVVALLCIGVVLYTAPLPRREK